MNEVIEAVQVSVGHHGREALKGEFISTSAIYSITPSFCPKPIAWGTFRGDADTHFYLCNFYSLTEWCQDFKERSPDPDLFSRQLATLHSHKSPNGKFGFECVTYNGNLPQDNTWCDSWEKFFANGLRHILKLREERAGPNAELDAVIPTLFAIVIPRLLRPLESNGRKVKPSLVHGDLWCGNASIVEGDPKQGIVYDPASFWAHNECKYDFLRSTSNEHILNFLNRRAGELASQTEQIHSGVFYGIPLTHRQIRTSRGLRRQNCAVRLVSDSRNLSFLSRQSPLTLMTLRRFNLHAAAMFPDPSYVQR